MLETVVSHLDRSRERKELAKATNNNKCSDVKLPAVYGGSRG